MYDARRVLAWSMAVLFVLLLGSTSAVSQEENTYFNPTAKPIPAGSKIYIAPIPVHTSEQVPRFIGR